MRTPYLCLFVFVMVLSSRTSVRSQSIWNQVLGTVGGQGTVGGNTISFTTGEVISGTAPLTSVKLTQGFHQTDQSVTVNISPGSEAVPTFNIYPNPTRGVVTVSISEPHDKASVRLFDITGKLLTEQPALTEQTHIDLSPYAAGMYIIQIIRSGEADRVARIQKVD